MGLLSRDMCLHGQALDDLIPPVQLVNGIGQLSWIGCFYMNDIRCPSAECKLDWGLASNGELRVSRPHSLAHQLGDSHL